MKPLIDQVNHFTLVTPDNLPAKCSMWEERRDYVNFGITSATSFMTILASGTKKWHRLDFLLDEQFGYEHEQFGC